MNQDITCPLCKMECFDLIGLKRHYHHGYCDVFNDTPYDDGVEKTCSYCGHNRVSCDDINCPRK